MSKSEEVTDWRGARRESARVSIVDAAWALVRAEGLAALSLRDLARRAGITTPTVYAYFDSKSDIYDAMFGQAAEDFAACMAAPYDTDNPREVLITGVRRFVDFCTNDVARYQLLFQRTVPGFEPSPDSYAPAQRALAGLRERLALNGITDSERVDMWTAMNTGLVDQQMSNDPGGDRWLRLVPDFVDMFLTYCESPKRPVSAAKKSSPRKSKGAPQ